MSATICAPTGDFEDNNQGPNWELAKALFFKGLPTKDVSKQANVSLAALWARMSREGWTKLRTESSAIVSVTVETKKAAPEGMSQSEASQLQNTSNLLLLRLQKRLEAITKGWDSQAPPKSLIGQSSALELLDKAAGIGKTLFGWGQGSTTMAISIQNLSTPAQWEPVQPTIDVGSVPVLPMVGTGDVLNSTDSAQPAGTEPIKHASDGQGQSKT